MTWAKLDDKFIRHPKVFGLSDGAFRLHISGIVYACEFETDGQIDAGLLRMLTRNESLVDELVAARLWDTVAGGWEIHDFLDWNPSKATLHEKRVQAKKRMNSVRTKGEPRENKSRTAREQRANPGTGRDGSTSGSCSGSEKPTEGKVVSVTAGKVARRLDPEWEPADLTAEQLAELGLTQREASGHLPHFRDHWAAAKDGARVDWQATWRNWLRSPYRKQERASGQHRVSSAMTPHQRSVDTARRLLDEARAKEAS